MSNTAGSTSPSRDAASSGLNESSSSSTLSQSSRLNTLRLDASRPYRNIFSSATTTQTRQIVVRSDPSLLTCFDPTDKELYDLWAPHYDTR